MIDKFTIIKGRDKMKKLEQAISRAKKSLIKKCERRGGVYENFGDKEVDKLTDKFIDSSDYSREMNGARDLINEFNEWCMSYEGERG